METVLFLCHRIPFPPNKGDKIATYNILKFLSKHFTVHCGYFIDDETDLDYQQNVDEFCQSTFAVDITQAKLMITGLKSLISGQSISVQQYRSNAMQTWVRETIKQHGIAKVFVYSSVMAQFIEHEEFNHCVRIVDMADVDSDKWLQYANKKPFPINQIYKREHRLLGRFEQSTLRKVEYVGLVTPDETALFKTLSPLSQYQKIITIGNGVDTEYFNPQAILDAQVEFAIDIPFICFTGAMDYWANVDAIMWFVEKVWPLLQKSNPELFLYIVGAKPDAKVAQLHQQNNIVVTGRVNDVRPYIKHAKVCVAPLQIARGVQNKVLEAMSMAKPVVMTSLAQEGIVLPAKQKEYVDDQPQKQADMIQVLLANSSLCDELGKENRQWITTQYGWNAALSIINELLQDKVITVNDNAIAAESSQ